MPLLHPFDDPVFAAIAAEVGIDRDETPEMFDPGLAYVNKDGHPFAEMPDFQFLTGDDSYPGTLTIWLSKHVRYHGAGETKMLTIKDQPLPDSIRVAAVGRPLADVLQIAGHEHFKVASIEDHAVDPNAMLIMLSQVDAVKPA